VVPVEVPAEVGEGEEREDKCPEEYLRAPQQSTPGNIGSSNTSVRISKKFRIFYLKVVSETFSGLHSDCHGAPNTSGDIEALALALDRRAVGGSLRGIGESDPVDFEGRGGKISVGGGVHERV
jgi:hypothetical protein